MFQYSNGKCLFLKLGGQCIIIKKGIVSYPSGTNNGEAVTCGVQYENGTTLIRCERAVHYNKEKYRISRYIRRTMIYQVRI